MDAGGRVTLGAVTERARGEGTALNLMTLGRDPANGVMGIYWCGFKNTPIQSLPKYGAGLLFGAVKDLFIHAFQTSTEPQAERLHALAKGSKL